MDWKTDAVFYGHDQFAKVGMACNRSFALVLVRSVSTHSEAENILCRQVNIPGKTHHEVAIYLHML